MKMQVSSAFSSIHGYTGDASIVSPCKRGYIADVSPRFLPAPSPGFSKFSPSHEHQNFLSAKFLEIYLNKS